MYDPANNPLDATDLAQLVSSGEASPLELVDQAIERIERLNPTINSVIHKRYDAARDEARGDLPDGPFKGVPFLTKDLGCAIAGEPMHLGNKLLKEIDLRSPVDSFLYEGFKSAGLITLGRTNTPELGSTVTTEPLAYGPTRSPWNLDHSVGGSSGGSAASVASGMVSMAHANDGGGSIRVPASECGLVGLKPSKGRVSQGPLIGDSWAGATIDGVVSRSVRDSAKILDIISGRRVGDPYTASPPARPF
ncbi:MAG: amidase, partial [Acidimicrobiales bacterium]